MKRFVFLFVFTLCFVEVFSQNQNNRKDSVFTYYAEAGLGLSIPQQEFKYNYIGDNDGYAKKGISLNLSAKAYKRKHVGYVLAFNAMVNPVDDSFYISPSETLTADVGIWKNINFCVGPSFRLPDGNFEFALNMPVGFIVTNRPEVSVYNYNSANGTINYIYTYSSGLSLGLCAFPEVSMSFDISEKVKIKLFSNYLFGYANVKYQLVYGNPTTQNSAVNASTLNQKIKVTSLNAGLSLVFKLKE